MTFMDQTDTVSVSEIIHLLQEDLGPATELCRAELARRHPEEKLKAGEALIENITTIYRRRFEHVHKRGIKTIGFAELLQALDTVKTGKCNLALVDSTKYHFFVVATESFQRLIGCLAVEVPNDAMTLS